MMEMGEAATKNTMQNLRVEIDTSAPFESVKEAVTRFGGVGYWKPIFNNISGVPSLSEVPFEQLDSEKLEEQTAALEKELILKERETLDVLKELENTKRLVEELKSKVQKEECEMKLNLQMSESDQRSTEKENLVLHTPSSPDSILMELKQAKLNLTQTTNDLAGVQASVVWLNHKLDNERISLEKTRRRLTQNYSRISSLEEELNQTRLRLQVAKEAEIKSASGDPSDITRELQLLSSEAEHFKKMREAAKSEALRTTSEIEQTKAKINTAEIRLVAATKIKEAARAAEAAALAEIIALSNHENSGDCDEITLSFEEYTALTCKARDAEDQSKRRVANAMLEVDEADFSRMDVLRRVEEATEEVKTSKKVLEEALERVEAANRGKLAVEECLRKWRSESHRRRTAIHYSTKFKTSYPSHHRRDYGLLDVNGMNLVNDEARPVLKPTLSIGQILSRKLFLPLEFEAGERNSVKRKVSLGQMLGKQNSDPSLDKQVEKENGRRQFSAKRKKFGFGRFSLLLSKQQNKSKKKPTLNLR